MALTAPTFLPTPHVLTAAEVNAALAYLTDGINANTAQIQALAAPLAPDLSLYQTDAEAGAHNSSVLAHPGTARLGQVPAGKTALIQVGQLTLNGVGGIVWTYATSYATGAVMAVLVSIYNATPAPCSVNSFTLTSADFRGPANSVIQTLVAGYI